MEVRIGNILVDRGVLTNDQVKAVLNVQNRTGQPFGLICEELYGVDPRLMSPDADALAAVTRRQAWQFNTIPISWDGPELMLATTPEALPRALRFATNVLGVPAYFVMCDPEALQSSLQTSYPLPGATLYGRRNSSRQKVA